MKLSKKKGLIVFDGDSVLLDFFEGFLRYLESKGYCMNHVKHLIGSTKFVPTEEITKNNCKTFNKQIMNDFASSGLLGELKLFQKDAQAILLDLHKEHELAVVTCIGTTPEIISQRNRNLINLYGDIFMDIRCINYGESKKKHLIELNAILPVLAFIDDRTKHLEEAKLAGVQPLLYSCGENACLEGSDGFSIINSLSEIKNYI